LASAYPAAARIFEQFGIDYCCGGEKSLAQACSGANLSLEEVQEAIEKPQIQNGDRDWQNASLTDLSEHIVGKHHAYVRDEIRRMAPLLEKVASVHGKNRPELVSIQCSFLALSEELTMHLMKEERMLFPYIVELENAANGGRRAAPPMFGTVQNPVRMMMTEHHSASSLLLQIRKESNNYALPADACTSFQMLYRALREFETDLHEHIHLENDILFPRAVELETRNAA
jgi:regulator of cell morphogenesis and NO signaling